MTEEVVAYFTIDQKDNYYEVNGCEIIIGSYVKHKNHILKYPNTPLYVANINNNILALIDYCEDPIFTENMNDDKYLEKFYGTGKNITGMSHIEAFKKFNTIVSPIITCTDYVEKRKNIKNIVERLKEQNLIIFENPTEEQIVETVGKYIVERPFFDRPYCDFVKNMYTFVLFLIYSKGKENIMSFLQHVFPETHGEYSHYEKKIPDYEKFYIECDDKIIEDGYHILRNDLVKYGIPFIKVERRQSGIYVIFNKQHPVKGTMAELYTSFKINGDDGKIIKMVSNDPYNLYIG